MTWTRADRCDISDSDESRRDAKREPRSPAVVQAQCCSDFRARWTIPQACQLFGWEDMHMGFMLYSCFQALGGRRLHGLDIRCVVS